jgi:uncharacterized protein
LSFVVWRQTKSIELEVSATFSPTTKPDFAGSRLSGLPITPLQTMESPPMPACLEATRTRDGRLLITCQVTPRARRERLACEGGKLRAWLHAPPVEGAANEALIELFARRLNLPRRAITLERGVTARQKTLAVEGLSEQEFWRRLGFTASE